MGIGLTIGAQAKELQPMLFNGVTAVLTDIVHKRFQLIAGEVLGQATALADKQMLMARCRGNKGVTTAGLMNALDKPELFELLKGTIDCDQTDGRVTLARLPIDFGGAQHILALGHDFDHSPPGFGEAVAIGLELGKPLIGDGGTGGHSGLLKMNFSFGIIAVLKMIVNKRLLNWGRFTAKARRPKDSRRNLFKVELS